MAHSRLRSKSDPRPFQVTAQSRPDLSLSVEERALRGSRSGRSWTAMADQFTMGLEPLIYSERSAAQQISAAANAAPPRAVPVEVVNASTPLMYAGTTIGPLAMVMSSVLVDLQIPSERPQVVNAFQVRRTPSSPTAPPRLAYAPLRCATQPLARALTTGRTRTEHALRRGPPRPAGIPQLLPKLCRGDRQQPYPARRTASRRPQFAGHQRADTRAPQVHVLFSEGGC